MHRTRSEQFREEAILSIVLDPDLGLCGWLGDKNIDNELYGFAPRQNFIRALAKEMGFQIRNMDGPGEHSTLRRVHRRFRQGLEKDPQEFNAPQTSKIAWGAFPEDPYAALEEVRKALGLSESQLDFFLAFLTKADDGHLFFHVGNAGVEFSNCSLDEKEIFLEVEVEKEKTVSSVKYRLSIEDNCLRSLDDSI